jgi:membrane associated rhomboid family serine protease
MNILRHRLRYSFFNATAVLVGVNALVFAAQSFLPYVTRFLALNPRLVMSGAFWQFATYMFVHGSLSHLLFNMLALFLFGTQVEREIGSAEFLLYYFVCGVLAGLFSFLIYLLTGAGNVVLLGASGAIFAVQLAFAVIRPDAVIYFWGLIPLRAPVMVLGATAIELFSSVFGLAAGVAHLTHLLGFAAGWGYFLLRFGANPWKYLFRRR